jgi:hypothetical protein
MIGNLSGRVVATTAAICLFAVALTASLNFYKFQSTLEELLRSRFAFLLRDMRNTLETGIDLGLPLRNLDNVQELIRIQAARDPDILSIEIFDAQGTVLFSTDTSFLGDLVAASWLDHWHRATSEIWGLREADANTLAITLEDNLGQVAGAIALRSSRRLENEILYRMGLRLATASAAVILLATAAGALVGFLILGPTRRRLLAMEAGTRGLLRQPSALAASLPLPMVDTSFAAFAATTRDAQTAIDDVAAEIQRLDREG